MLASLLLTAAMTALGVTLLGAMHIRRDPYYGALGLMALCVAGAGGAAYGILRSAG